MGDRGNIVIKQSRGDERVYLYSHWGGYRLPVALQAALAGPAGRNRWSDAPYLTRIIFDEMTGLKGGETGFGISTFLCDNEHPILVVDCEKREVSIEAEPGRRHSGDDGYVGKRWSFEDFLALPDNYWERF